MQRKEAEEEGSALLDESLTSNLRQHNFLCVIASSFGNLYFKSLFSALNTHIRERGKCSLALDSSL